MIRCKDCKHGKPWPGAEWYRVCAHPDTPQDGNIHLMFAWWSCDKAEKQETMFRGKAHTGETVKGSCAYIGGKPFIGTEDEHGTTHWVEVDSESLKTEIVGRIEYV